MDSIGTTTIEHINFDYQKEIFRQASAKDSNQVFTSTDLPEKLLGYHRIALDSEDTINIINNKDQVEIFNNPDFVRAIQDFLAQKNAIIHFIIEANTSQEIYDFLYSRGILKLSQTNNNNFTCTFLDTNVVGKSKIPCYITGDGKKLIYQEKGKSIINFNNKEKALELQDTIIEHIKNNVSKIVLSNNIAMLEEISFKSRDNMYTRSQKFLQSI